MDDTNSSDSLAARRGKIAGILHGRPVMENTTGKTRHGKHARVKQALQGFRMEAGSNPENDAAVRKGCRE